MDLLLPIETHLRERPDHPAGVHEDHTLTYAELDRRSNQLARALTNAGANKGDRVGILMNKSVDTLVAIYGILKAGAAYVPLDAGSPNDRLRFVVRDCGIRHVISAPDKRRQLDAIASEILYVFGADEIADAQCMTWEDIHRERHEPLNLGIESSDLAYVIYTSGSTGTPKGIMHTHASGAAFAAWAAAEYGLRPEDRVGNHSPLHFDISIFDLFATAQVGATVVLIGESYLKIPASYSEYLSRQRVSVLFTVPFALIQLLKRGVMAERDLSALRWVIFGGEPFPSTHLAELMRQLPDARFDNMYGPAEVNGCTHYTLTQPPEPNEPIPIGAVASIATAMIVDPEGDRAAPDQAGELWVKTPTMMRGYWGRSDLTEAAVKVVTEESGQSSRYYRTGDMVREQDGVLHFLGRGDRQVKVRGYRVELDEIELAMTACDGVEEAAAFVRDEADGGKVVLAAATLANGASIDARSIQRFLKQRLPSYAVPQEVTVREGFPRTTSGKIDRRALASEANVEEKIQLRVSEKS